MSNVKIIGNVSGTGTFTIEAPNSNTDRTLTLPDSAGSLVVSDGSGTITTTTLDLGNWTIVQSGTTLDFNYDGTTVFSVSSAGAVIAANDITAFGTP